MIHFKTKFDLQLLFVCLFFFVKLGYQAEHVFFKSPLLVLKKSHLNKGYLQELESCPEPTKRLHIWLIGLAQAFAPSLRNWPDNLNLPAAFEILVFIILKMLSTVTRVKPCFFYNRFTLVSMRRFCIKCFCRKW